MQLLLLPVDSLPPQSGAVGIIDSAAEPLGTDASRRKPLGQLVHADAVILPQRLCQIGQHSPQIAVFTLPAGIPPLAAAAGVLAGGAVDHTQISLVGRGAAPQGFHGGSQLSHRVRKSQQGLPSCGGTANIFQ